MILLSGEIKQMFTNGSWVSFWKYYLWINQMLVNMEQTWKAEMKVLGVAKQDQDPQWSPQYTFGNTETNISE